MSANEDKIKADKFALIYEFNNASPLFTRVASKFLENGEPNKALPILENGIKTHRTYPTAIILYSLALAMVGKKEDAYKTIEEIRDLFNSGDTISFYKSKIDSIQQAGASSDYKFSTSIFEKQDITQTSSETEPELIDTIKSDNTEAEDDLEVLAERLNSATMPLVDEEEVIKSQVSGEVNSNDGFPGKSLVSETLAKIYFNQGNYNEALSIYETLIEIQPEKTEYYRSQIEKINAQMNGKS